MDLKMSKEWCIGGLGGRKWKGEMLRLVLCLISDQGMPALFIHKVLSKRETNYSMEDYPKSIARYENIVKSK